MCLEGGADGGMLPGGMTNFGSGSFTWLSAGAGGTGARKMSLTLPGEVPLSAYENMALSLQKKPKGQGQTNKRDNNSRGGAGGSAGSPSSHTAKPKPKPRTGTGTGTQNPLQKVPFLSSSSPVVSFSSCYILRNASPSPEGPLRNAPSTVACPLDANVSLILGSVTDHDSWARQRNLSASPEQQQQ